MTQREQFPVTIDTGIRRDGDTSLGAVAAAWNQRAAPTPARPARQV